MAMQDLYNTLTDEQKRKFENCKSPEELLALANAENFALTPDQLEAASCCWGICGDYACSFQAIAVG